MQNGMVLNLGTWINNLKMNAPCCKYGGQRTVCWSLFSPPMWALGITLSLSDFQDRGAETQAESLWPKTGFANVL